MTPAQLAYAETFTRVRSALCDEVPHGRIHKGERPTIRIDLEDYARRITEVVLKAKGLL